MKWRFRTGKLFIISWLILTVYYIFAKIFQALSPRGTMFVLVFAPLSLSICLSRLVQRVSARALLLMHMRSVFWFTNQMVSLVMLAFEFDVYSVQSLILFCSVRFCSLSLYTAPFRFCFTRFALFTMRSVCSAVDENVK